MSYKVTIIVPVYNTEAFLKCSLDSLVKQTFKDIEILCVNDGSTDKSSDILQEYAQRDDRFVIIDTEHVGIGPARNLALKHARGEYIMFVDSDDWAEPAMCEIMYNTIVNKKVDAVFCSNTTWYNETRHEITPLSKEFKRRNLCISPLEIFTFEDIARYNLILMLTPWGKIFNRKFILDNNILFGNYSWGEDQLFNIHARLLAKMCYIDDSLYNYRKGCAGNSGKLVISYPIKTIYDDIKSLYSIYHREKYLEKALCEWARVFPVWGYRKLPENMKKSYLQECKSFLTKSQYKIMKRKLGQDILDNTLKAIFSVENEYEGKNKYKIIRLMGTRVKLKSWR